MIGRSYDERINAAKAGLHEAILGKDTLEKALERLNHEEIGKYLTPLSAAKTSAATNDTTRYVADVGAETQKRNKDVDVKLRNIIEGGLYNRLNTTEGGLLSRLGIQLDDKYDRQEVNNQFLGEQYGQNRALQKLLGELGLLTQLNVADRQFPQGGKTGGGGSSNKYKWIEGDLPGDPPRMINQETGEAWEYNPETRGFDPITGAGVGANVTPPPLTDTSPNLKRTFAPGVKPAGDKPNIRPELLEAFYLGP